MHLFILAAALVALVPRPGLAESICRELHAPLPHITQTTPQKPTTKTFL